MKIMSDKSHRHPAHRKTGQRGGRKTPEALARLHSAGVAKPRRTASLPGAGGRHLPLQGGAPSQERACVWLKRCFGEVIASDIAERNHRFLEEALELVQSLGCTKSEALQLVDYVYGRNVGQVRQEIGGVMVTLSALSSACDTEMME
jgi:hypothetical protein